MLQKIAIDIESIAILHNLFTQIKTDTAEIYEPFLGTFHRIL